MAAPHARGSTPVIRAPSPYQGVPRSHGGTPQHSISNRHASRRSPHARGSTEVTLPAGGILHGPPARTGLDPGQRRAYDPYRAVPRSHGGRPNPNQPSTTRPGRTGINPGSFRNRPARAHGNRPSGAPDPTTFLRGSPHARGSSDLVQHRLDGNRGPPDRTGIHRRRRAALLRSSRSPHAHGEPPATWYANPNRLWVAPRARGTTSGLAGLRLAADWLPRQNGDPPKLRFRPASFWMAAPLARG